jgi:polar amino acid transport system permease protein
MRLGATTQRALVTLAVVGGLVGFLLLAPRTPYRWERIWGAGGYGALILGGLVTTAWVSLVAMVLGLVLGFAGGRARLARSPAVQQVGTLYVEIVRSTPFLIQVLVAYYGVAPLLRDLLLGAGVPPGVAGLFNEPIFVGVLALGLFCGAYVTEIVRAAVESVDRGQAEAALAQGMSHAQVLRLVLFPQALRRMIPPLTGELVSLVKDSSILSIIAVAELSKRASEVQAATYLSFEVLLPVALLYLALTFPLGRLARHLEQRLHAGA